MNAPTPIHLDLPAIGAPFAGGFFAGTFQLDDGTRRALIVAPKALGEHAPAALLEDLDTGTEHRSYSDGRANTATLAAAGIALAKWAQGLDIDSHTDWYLPSQDELEILYRNLKPATEKNWCYARSGINLSALPTTRPYTPDHPVQTPVLAFQTGGPEAFDEAWYWSSTQHAAHSLYAWSQSFDNGDQNDNCTSTQLRARAVRSVTI